MTFSTYESSAQDGAPVELYEFTIAATVYRFIAAPDDLLYEAHTFEAIQITRTEIEDTGDLPRDSITITVPRDNAVADQFRIAPPSDVVAVKIRKLHLSDPALESKVIWLGRVLNADWKGVVAELTCESIQTSLRRPGLRRKYQRGCPHDLYGTACGAPRSSFKTTASLNFVSATTVKSPTFDVLPDGWFDGGDFEWEVTPGRFERRAVRTHVGDTLTLSFPIPGLAAGALVNAYAGCAHEPGVCDTKFGRILSYGGTPHLQSKNPFGGTNVWE